MANKKRLITSVRVFTFLSKTIGFLPLKFGVSEHVRISVVQLCYGSTLLLTIFVLRCYVFYNIPSTDVAVVLFKTNELVTPVCILFCYFCYIINIKKISQILNEVFTLSELISTTVFYQNAKKLTISQTVILLTILLSYYITSVIDNLYFFPNDTFSVVFIFLDKFVESYMRFGAAVIVLQFANVLFFFREMILIINEDLSSMVGRNLFVTRSSLNPVKKERLQDSKILKIAVDTDNITPLIDMHDHICDLCGKWNRFFGGSLTGFSLQVLVQILTALYNFMTPENRNFPVNFLLTILYHSLEFWFVLYACELVTQEAKRTGVLVHRVIKNTKNLRIKSQLQEFSAELLHRDISFSAWRLFPLNYTLLHSIAAAITTYIVILVQFRNADGLPKPKPNATTTPRPAHT